MLSVQLHDVIQYAQKFSAKELFVSLLDFKFLSKKTLGKGRYRLSAALLSLSIDIS